MKPVPLSVASAILVLLSCTSVHTAESQDSLKDKVAKLEAEMIAKTDRAFKHYSELTDSLLKLERRLTDLERENQLLKIEVKQLRDKVAGSGGTGREGAAAGPDLAEISMKIDTALAKLKATANVEEAVKELVPLSRYSVTKMVEALRQISSPDYTAALEKVLAKCPVEDLKGPLGKAVEDRIRRTSVARVIGAVGDTGLSKFLETYTGDADPIIQVELGVALLDCKNRMGVPALLRALRASDSDCRLRAILRLKKVSKGETFGFDLNKSADENAAALKSWDDWWQKEGQKLFE
ncbi:MAG TPA: hypothetical protein VGK61_09300 [Planctomycetota bacterium]|jgi:hypothetical protein